MTVPGLTVAVTGPTGEIGVPFIRALEETPQVGRVLAMARRAFAPEQFGWTKTEYRQGDILDRDAVDDLVRGCDAVVHLAFIVVKASAGSADINIEGSRNVFGATVDARVPRLLYTSSVAAYGYHEDVTGPLTEDMATRGSERHAYSHQKAEVERVLDETLQGGDTLAWVFRPCVVAGPDAPALLHQMPYHRFANVVPRPLRALPLRRFGVKPLLPDPGIPLQLVHHDDVANALVAGVLGQGAPGIYNLAGDGEIHLRDIANALGWYTFPVPRGSVGVAARALSFVPPFATEAGWLQAMRTPMLMDTSRARQELGWKPLYSSRETLTDLVRAYRSSR